GRYWVNNHAHVLAFNGRADLRFLVEAIERTDLKPFLSGTAQPKLNRANLDRVPLATPPLPLQREFSARTSRIDALASTLAISSVRLDELFASLQHRAFRGEL